MFDFVRCQTQHLVVVVTEDVFARPWCVGEMVTARANGVSTVPVFFPGVKPPATDFIENYDQAVPDWSLLASLNMTLSMVRETLMWVSTLPRLSIENACSTGTIRRLAAAMPESRPLSMEKDGLDKVITVEEEVSNTLKTMVLADPTSTEAMSTAQVLHYFARNVMSSNPDQVPHVLGLEEVMPQSAINVVMVCTKGVFEQPKVARALLKAGELNCAVVPVLGDDEFRFPTTQYLRELSPVLKKFLTASETENVLDIIQAVFKDIAVVFNPKDYSASEAVLQVKAQEIADRLTVGRLKKLKSTKSASSGGFKEVPQVMEVTHGEVSNNSQISRM